MFFINVNGISAQDKVVNYETYILKYSYDINYENGDVWTYNKLCKQEATALFQVLFQCHQYASQRLKTGFASEAKGLANPACA